jgi:Domain of unknown function (DUF4410)
MKTPALLLSASSLALLCGCASVSVKSENRTGAQPAHKPAKIYVADFDASRAVFKIGGQQANDPEAYKKNAQKLLSGYLVKNLTAHIAPAEAVKGAPGRISGRGWLLTGQFVRVNTGSRFLRATVGLGAGGTKMETRVEVYDLASQGKPFLRFETTGGSNAMPGLLEATGPASAVLSPFTQAMMGVSDDAARTSRMITGALSEYLAARGWIAKNKMYESKKPGQYQLIHEQWIGN